MIKNHYTSGDWNVICDVCGQKHKSSNMKKRWDGLIVCPDDFEIRHEQDFIRAKVDKIVVPWTRPRPIDAFIYTHGLFDVVEPSDSEVSLDYIDTISGYFAEDYVIDYTAFIIKMNWAREFDDTVTSLEDSLGIAIDREAFSDSVALSDTATIVRRFVRTFNDTTIISETGSGVSIFNTDYIDATYFLGNDYVGSSYTL